MRPGHWLESVLCVSFGALTLLVGDSKDIWPGKNRVTHPKVFFHKRQRTKTEEGGNRLIQVYLEKGS